MQQDAGRMWWSSAVVLSRSSPGKIGKGYEKGCQYPCQGSHRVPRKYKYEPHRLRRPAQQ